MVRLVVALERRQRPAADDACKSGTQIDQIALWFDLNAERARLTRIGHGARHEGDEAADHRKQRAGPAKSSTARIDGKPEGRRRGAHLCQLFSAT